MCPPSTQEVLKSADKRVSREPMEEDALLLHVSECSHCLNAAIRRRERLDERGCLSFQKLAARLSVPVEVAERIAVGEGHLQHDVVEEYCFGRLSQVEMLVTEGHLGDCVACRRTVSEHREFIACLKHVLNSWTEAGARAWPNLPAMGGSTPRFGPEALAAAHEKLPVSRVAGLQALRLMERESVSLDQLDSVLRGDPVVSAHLVRVANSALLSYGQEVRTVGQAISRIGLERTKLHVCGLAVKRMYSSPHLQKIWNHSILAAQVARQLAGMTRGLSADEASLVALVHDIGHLVLANLGQPYERARTQRMSRGALPIEAEEQLCGATHAAIGADLLEGWRFPAELVEAVRFHHSPSDRVTALSALLYVVESWLDNQEDVCDIGLHLACIRRLGISKSDLAVLGVKHSPDLELLRFAA